MAALNVDLIVPYSPGDPARSTAWGWVLERYRQLHPGLTVTVGRDLAAERDGEPWSKGRAVANGVRRTRAPFLVVADADVIVDPEALGYSIIAVMHGAPWSQPHGEVHRLSRRATIAVYGGSVRLEGAPPFHLLERAAHPAAQGGGMVVLTRSAYEVSGGIDPRFVGFGGDDISWARALDTLCGPCTRFNYPMTHLWHERTYRRFGNRGSEENEALAARYMIAEGDSEAMRAIIDEHATVQA